MAHSPRNDNALFWGVAGGILGMFGYVAGVMGVSSLLGVTLPLEAGYLTYVVGAIVGRISYYVVWKRGAAKQYAREGRCVQCGYDLTGNVSGRCPGCGAATGKRKRQSNQDIPGELLNRSAVCLYESVH
jgi:hypothetical protein